MNYKHFFEALNYF